MGDRHLLASLPAAKLAHKAQGFALDSSDGMGLRPQWATEILLMAVLALAGLATAHAAALALWRFAKRTKDQAAPDVLLFPVPELLLANALVLPVAMAATVLLLDTSSPANQGIGALSMLVVLAYIMLLAPMLFLLVSKHESLGLKYTLMHGEDMDVVQPVGSGLPTAEQRSTVAWLLARFAPLHTHGFWERPDLQAVQKLRLVNEGEPG